LLTDFDDVRAILITKKLSITLKSKIFSLMGFYENLWLRFLVLVLDSLALALHYLWTTGLGFGIMTLALILLA